MKVGTFLKLFGTQTEFARFIGTTRQNVGNWKPEDDLQELYDLRLRRDHPIIVKAVELLEQQAA